MTQAGVIWEDRNPLEQRLPPLIKPVGHFFFFLLVHLCRRVPVTVGSDIPGLMVLGAIKKLAEQAMWTKPISSNSP